MNNKMSRRNVALEIIRIDARQHGYVTQTGMRAYIEGNVSLEAFEKAAQQGRRFYKPIKEDGL